MASKTCDDFVEAIVCCQHDINDNEMKVFQVPEFGEILLIRQNKDKITALGSKCTHYGADLIKGVLGKDRIRCPWHGACFNTTTGDIEDFPGLDSLPCYEVTSTCSNIKIRARREDVAKVKRQKPMCYKECTKDQRKIVVVGGGPSGAVCVETLRQEQFKGSITLVSKEKYLPYDRTKISKNIQLKMEKIQLRSNDFYKTLGVEILLGIEATNVNTSCKKIRLSNGEELRYDILYIATGSRPTKRDIPGTDLKNVVVLRSYDDSKTINDSCLCQKDKEVVIFGSSFISMEVSAAIADKVGKLTIISIDEMPYQNTLGPKIGQALMNLFKSKSVNFIMKTGLKCCKDGGNGSVKSVELTNGQTVNADLVILGLGIVPNSEFLNNSNIGIRENGFVEVDEYLKTNVCQVYAGGDVAFAPVWCLQDVKSTIAHFGWAQYHGKMAALNMLENNVKLKAVPFFWTMLFGKGIRYAGFGTFDDIIYHGNVEELKFVAFYINKDQVVAISSCGMDPIAAQFAELLFQGKKLTRCDIQYDPLGWTNKISLD